MSLPPGRDRQLKVQLYTPHAGQMVLHSCKKRFRIMSCGRRFGKTLAGTNEISKFALEHAHSLCWWVAPTYRQTEIAFDLLAEALRPVCAKEPNRSKLRIDLINGSIVECRSAERYENMRGDGPDFVVIDEASKVPRAAWFEVIRPALADKQGQAIIISTPWGRDWFWELYMLGQNEDDPEYWSKSFPTSANPFIPEGEIENARRTLPKRVFEQEFEAIFHDDAATVFRGISECAVGSFKEPDPMHSYVIGWDIAKYTDYSVLTCMDMQTQEVVAWDRFNGIEYKAQIPRVKEMADLYNNAHVLMDSTGVGDPVLEEARDYGIDIEGYYLTNASKAAIIDRLVVAIEKQQVLFPPIEVLLNELKAFSYELTKSRNIVYSAPEGTHDDTVISFALAVYGARMGGPIPMAVTRSQAVPDPTKPQAIETNDPFIQARQQQMGLTLNKLRSVAQEALKELSGWGIG